MLALRRKEEVNEKGRKEKKENLECCRNDSENKGGMVMKYNDIMIKKKVTINGRRRIMMRLRREEN
jgi:hypothetical protein